MWPVLCPLESTSPVEKEVVWDETERVGGLWKARRSTNGAFLEGLQRDQKRFGEPRFPKKSSQGGTYMDDGLYLVVCPLVLIGVFTREGGGG